MKEESEKVGLKLNIQKTKVLASGLITSWQIDGERMERDRLYFGGSKVPQMVTAAMKFKMLALWKISYVQPRECIKKQRHYIANKVYLVKAMEFSVVMYGCESWTINKECWVPENWCFWTVVLEKTLESLLDCKEIQPVHPKGNQSWVFIGRTDAEAETPVLWPPDVKIWLIGKDPDAGGDWRWEEKGTTENDMVWMASLTRWTWV